MDSIFACQGEVEDDVFFGFRHPCVVFRDLVDAKDAKGVQVEQLLSCGMWHRVLLGKDGSGLDECRRELPEEGADPCERVLHCCKITMEDDMAHEQLKIIGRVRKIEPPEPTKPYARLWVLVEKAKKKAKQVMKHWYSVFLTAKLLSTRSLQDICEDSVVVVEGAPSWNLDTKGPKEVVERMILAGSWPEVIPVGPQHGLVGFERITFVSKVGSVEECEGEGKRYARLSLVVSKPKASGGASWYSLFMFESLLKGHEVSRYAKGRTVYVEGTPDPVAYDGEGGRRLDVQVIASSWPQLID